MSEGARVKINVMLSLETAIMVKKFVQRVQVEMAEKRYKRKPGRPVGEGNLVAWIFERAIKDNPKYLDEWRGDVLEK